MSYDHEREKPLSEHHAYYVKRFVESKYLPVSKKLRAQPYSKYFKSHVLSSLSNFMKFELNVNQRKEFHLLFKKIHLFEQNHLESMKESARKKKCNYLIDLNYSLIKNHSRYLLKDQYLYLVFSYFFRMKTSGDKTYQDLKHKKEFQLYEQVLLNFNTFYKPRPSTYKGTFQAHPNNHNQRKDHNLKNTFGKIFPREPKKYEKVDRRSLIEIETQYKQDFCNMDKVRFSKEKDEQIKEKEQEMKKSLKKDLLSKNLRPFHFDEKLNYKNLRSTSQIHLENTMKKNQKLKANAGSNGSGGLTFGDEKLNKKMLQDPHSASFGVIIPQKKTFQFEKQEKKKKNVKHLKSSKLLSVGKFFSNSTYHNHFFEMKNLGMNKVDRHELNKRNFGKREKPYACVVNDQSKLFLDEKNKQFAIADPHTREMNARQPWKTVLNGKTALV